MVITMGVIDCTTEDFDAVSSIVNHWFDTYEEHSYIKDYNLKVVPSSYENFYGGVKVGFFVAVKKSSWDFDMHEQVIKNFESLMNILPFQNASLYNSFFSCFVEWFLATPENIDSHNQVNAIIENTDYPHIVRITKAEIRDLPYTKLFDF